MSDLDKGFQYMEGMMDNDLVDDRVPAPQYSTPSAFIKAIRTATACLFADRGYALIEEIFYKDRGNDSVSSYHIVWHVIVPSVTIPDDYKQLTCTLYMNPTMGMDCTAGRLWPMIASMIEEKMKSQGWT